MIFETFPVGAFQCNCLIIACEETRSGIVIDPGGDEDRILSVLSKHQIETVYLLHTHAHLDHVGATKPVHEKAGGETCLHEDDMFLCNHLPAQAELFGLPTPETPTMERFLKHGDRLTFGKQSVEVLHTPGHTPGSLSFYIDGVGLITGDTLFAGSVGRTDLWKGSHPDLIASIKQRLLTFSDETTVYPGHGPKTQIGAERQNNPFL